MRNEFGSINLKIFDFLGPRLHAAESTSGKHSLMQDKGLPFTITFQYVTSTLLTGHAAAHIDPDDHEEQQNFLSWMCFTSSPINHDPALTSSCAYVRRIYLLVDIN